MKQVDEDNCLTTLAEQWTGLQDGRTAVDERIAALNELGEKHSYTVKVYNLLGVSLMLKGDFERALLIFETALGDIEKELYSGNRDLASLLANCIKCKAIMAGSFTDIQGDEKVQQLFSHLKKVSPKDTFVKERQQAEEMFDEAASQV